jgi:hypothetical protein
LEPLLIILMLRVANNRSRREKWTTTTGVAPFSVVRGDGHDFRGRDDVLPAGD